jgi:hypothetical protein
MFASAFVPWVRKGPGSGLRGHALVDAVVALGRHVPALSAGRLTVVWYLIPAAGAASWIVAGLVGTRHLAGRVLSALAVVIALAARLAFGHVIGAGRLGWGPNLALIGAGLMAAAAWLPLGVGVARRRLEVSRS